MLYIQKRKLDQPQLHLTEEQIQSYALFEIEQILQRSDKLLRDYGNIPLPNASLLRELNNRLLTEETNYNRKELQIEFTKLYSGLSTDQLTIFEAIVKSTMAKEGKLFFISGHGGMGKTYLWKIILVKQRSEGHIALAVASSEITSLLLSEGRTVHSRFHTSLNLTEDTTCEIKQET